MKASIGKQALADFWSPFHRNLGLHRRCWSVEMHDEEAAGSPSVLLYVWDSDTGWTWLCSVPRQPGFDT